MEIKLQDFPCFYYAAKYGTRSEQIKYYATVSSMLGYSMEEAANSSVYFSHVTKGKLFSNGTYTAELLQNSLYECFKEQDVVHCGKLSSRKRNPLKDIVNKCCAICPLSTKYLNNNQHDEFVYLKGVIEHPEWLNEFVLDSSQFLSWQSLSLSNDVTFDILPITSIIHQHLCTVKVIRSEKLSSELCAVVNTYLASENISEPAVVGEVPTFVKGILLQIMNVVPQEITEAQIHSAWKKINSNYLYTPPRTVLPVEENEQRSRHERKQGISKLNTFTNNNDKPEVLPEAEKLTILSAEKENIMSEQRKQTADDLQFSDLGVSMGAIFGLMNMTPPSIALERTEQSVIPEESEQLTIDSQAAVENNDSVLSEPDCAAQEEASLGFDGTSQTEADFPEQGELEDYSDFSYDTVLIEDVPEDLEFPCPEEFPTEEQITYPNLYPDEEIEKVADQEAEPIIEEMENNTDSPVIVESEDVVSEGEPTNTSEPDNEAESALSEESSITNEEVSTELVLASPGICTLCCSGVSANSFNSVLRTADAIQYAFFLRCMSRIPTKEQFSMMRNKNGCALCPKEGKNKGCIYPSLSLRDNTGSENAHKSKKEAHNTFIFAHSVNNMVHKIDIDFIPYIISCTDSCKSNLIDFITEACNTTEISIECVELHSVKGLLFYVGGKFYFFDPAYGASGFLNPLFSDATKTKFYSMNPIQVHACLYQIGFKHIRIESVAALYSTFHNLNVLAPVGFIFGGYMHEESFTDMYARIMPYYSIVWNSLYKNMNTYCKKAYEYGIRLEYALGKNKDISRISIGHEHNVVGGNYLHYRLTMRHLEDLNVPGCHISVKLNNSDIQNNTKKKVYEVTAGKLGASTSRVHNYTYLLSLSSDNISYYCCYEDKVFFDEFMSCIRAAFKEVVGGTPDVSVERTYFSL